MTNLDALRYAQANSESVLVVLVSIDPHPRISVGDRVENMIVDKAKIPAEAALVVTCVHHSVYTHAGKTYLTTRLETEARPFE